MARAARVALRWIGRGLIALAIYVLVASLFFPSGIQSLNSIACPAGLELDNSRYTLPNGPDSERLELVCTSPNATQSAARDIALIVAALVVVGLAAIYLGERMGHPRMRVPDGPTIR